jgi:hypothetical protein
MRSSLILAATFAMFTTAALAHDPSGRPEAGNFAPHVTGTGGDGRPEIHRPDASSHAGASGGVASMPAGAQDGTVVRSGPGRGTLGTPAPGRVVDNEDGRPVIEHGHRPAGSR